MSRRHQFLMERQAAIGSQVGDLWPQFLKTLRLLEPESYRNAAMKRTDTLAVDLPQTLSAGHPNPQAVQAVFQKRSPRTKSS